MRSFEPPDTPAQTFAGVAGLFLVALGVLALMFTSVDFGTVGEAAAEPEFLIWSVGGWTTVFWMAIGALGLLAVPRLAAARTYALFAGIVFAAVAVWGLVDGNDVAEVLVADSTNNITHAVLGVLGLVIGVLPQDAQGAPGNGARERRFDRELQRRETARRR